MVRQLRRFRSFFNRTKETNMSEMLGTGKGGLDREYNGEENNTGRLEAGRTFECNGVFNEYLRQQRLPDPEKGEEYCHKCEGVGISKAGEVCEKCWGQGIIDWITNAMGNRHPFSSSSSSSYSSIGSSPGQTIPIGNNNVLGHQANYVTSVSYRPYTKTLWSVNSTGPPR